MFTESAFFMHSIHLLSEIDLWFHWKKITEHKLFQKVPSLKSVNVYCVCINHCLKVYTVGPEYAHAEARKSPSLDGKVERDSQGKEIRYPVILNQYEKELANKVCKLFKVWHSDLFVKLLRKKNLSWTVMNCWNVCLLFWFFNKFIWKGY